MSLWNRIQVWLWGSRSAAQQLADQWEKSAGKLVKELDVHREELSLLQVKLVGLSKRLEVDLEQAATIQRQHQTAIDALRSENQVLSEATVPALVASNRLLLQRYDAETAIEVRKMVAASGRPDEM